MTDIQVDHTGHWKIARSVNLVCSKGQRFGLGMDRGAENGKGRLDGESISQQLK